MEIAGLGQCSFIDRPGKISVQRCCHWNTCRTTRSFVLYFSFYWFPLTASLSQPKPKIRMWEVFDSGRALCSCLSPVIHDLAELTAQLLTIVCALTHPNMNRRGQLINDYTTCLMYCSARRAQWKGSPCQKCCNIFLKMWDKRHLLYKLYFLYRKEIKAEGIWFVMSVSLIIQMTQVAVDILSPLIDIAMKCVKF